MKYIAEAYLQLIESVLFKPQSIEPAHRQRSYRSKR